MRTIDFSAVKPGDIIVVVDPSPLEHDMRHVLEYCTSKNVVTATNGVDSLVMVDTDYPAAVLTELITKTSGGFMCEPMNGASEPKLLPTECLYHFTFEEYKSARMDERIAAQSKLVRSMRFWYGTEAPFPKAVAKAVEQAIEDKMDKHMSNVNVVNIESAHKTMGEIIEVTEKAYRDIIAENMGVMDELIQRANTANAEITAIAQSLNPWRNDGESVTLVRQYARGGYSISTQHSTFRVGSGIMTHSKDVYFIERVTKSRAYVSDPATGEQVGYLTTRKNSGVVLKFSDGSTETLDVLYQVIPASTPEDVLAYKAAYMEASRIMDELHGYIDQMKKSKLDGFNVACPSLSSLGALDSAYATAISTVSSLEREKSRVLEGMEATILKMKRLHQLAYGD